MADRQPKAAPQSQITPASPTSSLFEQRGFADPVDTFASTGSVGETPSLQTQRDRSARLGHQFRAVNPTPSPAIQPQISLIQNKSTDQDHHTEDPSTAAIGSVGSISTSIQRQVLQALFGSRFSRRRSGSSETPSASTDASLGSRTLRLSDPMMEGEDVRELQEKLIEQGHSVGSSGADGIFGQGTHTAVMAFQTAEGIQVDGIVGPETLSQLTVPTAPETSAEPEIPEEPASESQTPEPETSPEAPTSDQPPAPALEVPSEDVDIMARTLYGEARGESAEGKAGVGWVIRHRADRPAWPAGIAAVCQQPYQFSCWNPGDPNLEQLQSVTTENPIFAECVQIANQVISGAIPDPTNGADHYYANYIAPPSWAQGETPVAQIGVHLFFNLTGTQQPTTPGQEETNAQAGGEESTGERTLKLTEPPMRGEDVRQVQEQLIDLGHAVGRYGADGIFGQSTHEAVMAFQRSVGIEVDGIVGPQTRQQLSSPTTSPQPDPDQEETAQSEPSDSPQNSSDPQGEETPYGTKLPNGDIQFTENFRLSEFTRSQTAQEQGLNNDVPEELLGNLYELCVNVLQPLRDALGPVTITSGYRSPAVNEAVGGSATSQHMAGQAADLVISGKSVRQVCNYIDQNLPHDQLIYEFGSWTHVSYVSSGNRYQYFDIT